MAEHGDAKKEVPTGLGFGSGSPVGDNCALGRRGSGKASPRHAQAGRDAGRVESLSGLDGRRDEKGGEVTESHPTDRGKAGARCHLLIFIHGLPLAVAITGANRHDSLLGEPILDGRAPVKGPGRGRPRRRPGKLHAGKAVRSQGGVRRYLRRCGITARITHIGADSSECLGRHRQVGELTISWLLAFRRLDICYDRSVTTITAVATQAFPLIRAPRLP